jgi:transcriptional regulator with XRE-family HTH domain/KaiC/GvpD/RAD55 family RecA-like ATPase
MTTQQLQVASGVSQLDNLLGGLHIGDNVVWYDNAGSLAPVFYLNFIKASQAEDKPIIYLNFDRSIKNLLEQLGPLADYTRLTVLDCFTFGKGEGAEVFLGFYETDASQKACRIIRVDEPRNLDHVTGAFYGLHKTMSGDVRFVFDSLTGMQQLWGGEEQILKFYSHSCPRLYELNTIAYWVVEKEAHSQRLRAHINKIAQVAIELSLKRGKTSLTIVKAEKRNLESLNKPFNYWCKDLHVNFDAEKRATSPIHLGARLRALRMKRALSQTELARLVGVTPSTISQVEGNQIYPSLPALIKMAEILSVEMTTFFQNENATHNPVTFSSSEAVEVPLPNLPKESITGKLITPIDSEHKAEPYLLEIPPGKKLPSHFFSHKGEEIGYLLSGKLQLTLEKSVHTLKAGDLVYLASEMPLSWKNMGHTPARLLWIKFK